MQIENAKRWAKAGPEPFVVGLLGYFLALALRFALNPLLDDHLPMLFFAINCAVVAFMYGFWPSFLILLLSLPTASFFFVKPFYTFDTGNYADMFMMIVYFTLVTSTAFMLEWVRREQYRAVLLARVSDTRYRLLVEADEDRRAMLKKNAAA
jgi:K+-sensing histidine kinase KdpD